MKRWVRIPVDSPFPSPEWVKVPIRVQVFCQQCGYVETPDLCPYCDRCELEDRVNNPTHHCTIACHVRRVEAHRLSMIR